MSDDKEQRAKRCPACNGVPGLRLGDRCPTCGEIVTQDRIDAPWPQTPAPRSLRSEVEPLEAPVSYRSLHHVTEREFMAEHDARLGAAAAITDKRDSPPSLHDRLVAFVRANPDSPSLIWQRGEREVGVTGLTTGETHAVTELFLGRSNGEWPVGRQDLDRGSRRRRRMARKRRRGWA